MYARKCTIDEMNRALAIVNKKYDGNVRFKDDIETTRHGLQFGLRPVGKRGKGNSVKYRTEWDNKTYPKPQQVEKKRYISACCWHVHGDFFDALFSVNSNAVVYSKGTKITKQYGNWQDSNVGSQMYPAMHSEQCECNS